MGSSSSKDTASSSAHHDDDEAVYSIYDSHIANANANKHALCAKKDAKADTTVADDAGPEDSKHRPAVRQHAQEIPDAAFEELHDIEPTLTNIGAWIRTHGINVCNSKGLTLMHIANSRRYVEYLCRSGLDINVRDYSNRSALHYRCERGADLKLIDFMIAEKGAYAMGHDKDGITPLHLAAGRDRFEIVKLLVEKHNVPFDTCDRKMQTPLHECAWNGATKTMQFLIERAIAEKRVDAVDKPDERGITPLLAAATEGRVDIVKLLLSGPNKALLNVNVAALDNEGDGALNRCTWEGHCAIARFLIDECGAEVDIRDKAQLTPLHSAVYNQQLEMSKLLLMAGASVDAQDVQGDTPLHIAVEGRSLDLVKLLCIRGSNVFLPNNDGFNPAQLAVEFAQAEATESAEDKELAVASAGGMPAYRVAQFLIKFIKGMDAARRKLLSDKSKEFKVKRKEQEEMQKQKAEHDAEELKEEIDEEEADRKRKEQEEEEALQRAFEEVQAEEEALQAQRSAALDNLFGTPGSPAKPPQQQQKKNEDGENNNDEEQKLQEIFDAEWAAQPASPTLNRVVKLPQDAIDAVAEEAHAEASRADFQLDGSFTVGSPSSPARTKFTDNNPSHNASLTLNTSASLPSPGSPAGAAVAASPASPGSPFRSISRALDIWSAATNGDLSKVMAILEANPALIKRKNREGRTALFCAAVAGQAKVVAYLLGQADVDTKGRDSDGWTPVMAAAFYNHLESVKKLVDAGASLIATTAEGNTVLHIGVQGSASKMLLRYLCLSGADPHAKNNAGKTPLNLADESNKKELAEYLRVVSAFTHNSSHQN